jgi:hypothetical protein
LVAAAVAAFSAGWKPWLAAAAGAFVPADIAQDAAAARLFTAGINPYGPAIRDAQAALTGLARAETFPHFPHPPFSLILSWPMAPLDYRGAAMLWFVLSMSLLVVLAGLLGEVRALDRPVTRTARFRTGGLFLLLLVWPPVLYNLEKGQWSILLAVLAAVATVALLRRRVIASAMWLGAAAAIKVFPVVIGLHLLLRSRGAFVAFCGTGAVLTILPLFWLGPGAFLAFVSETQANMPYWESFPAVTLSLHGAVARLFVGGEWAEPIVRSPLIAKVVDVAIVLPLIALAVSLTSRAGRGQVPEAVALSGWIILLPMLNPQSLGHNAVLLAVPFIVTLNGLEGGPHWRYGAWSTAIVLNSIPRQTLALIAPPPITPFEGLAVIALPMWGTLLLFLVVLTDPRIVRPASRPEPARPAGVLG